jgi:hypothetical protein
MYNLQKVFLLISTIFFTISCNNKENSGLTVIPVDIDQDKSLPLSEIADDIKQIELELTDESLIGRVRKVLLCGDYYAVLTNYGSENRILLFDATGKYIRQIGSTGQGPGEFTRVYDIACDVERGYFFAMSYPKIICYDLAGHFVKESSGKRGVGSIIVSLNYVNDALLYISEDVRKDETGSYTLSTMYKMDDDMQVKDSIEIRRVYFDKPGIFENPTKDFITDADGHTYFYYSDLYHEQQNPAVSILRDTLYQKEDTQLIPYLRLKFKDDGIDAGGKKYIQLLNIYRSSRFVFSRYSDSNKNESYFFCYDTKNEKGYNMKDGYTDDFYHIPKKAVIRPFASSPEKFYYLYTDLDKAVDGEEPNPTLYVGTLKK